MPAGDDFTRIRETQRACLACGIGVVAVPERVETFTAMSVATDPPGHQRRQLPYVELTRCAECSTRHEKCRELLDEHRAVRASMGSRDVAEHRLAAVSDALAALGREKDLEHASEQRLKLLLRHLLDPGVGVRFSNLFAPIWSVRAGVGMAASSPWSHVTDDERAPLVEAYSRVLSERVAASAPPRRLPPPTGSGCLFCGLNAVVMPEVEVRRRGGPQAAAQTVWRSIDTDTRALGSRGRSERRRGSICPECSTALESAGAVGATVLEKSLRDHLRAVGRDDEARWIDIGEAPHLRGWGALSGAEPSDERWSHVGHLVLAESS